MAKIKSFPVSDTLRIEAKVTNSGTPYLAVCVTGPCPSAVCIYLDEVKDLIAQLVEATVYLLEGQDGSNATRPIQNLHK